MSPLDCKNQVKWVGESIIGHAFEPKTHKIDMTEGFGAFDSIFTLPYAISGRAIDIGGGSSDANCAYVAYKYLVNCKVYDPFMRSKDHNMKILQEIKNRAPVK